MINDRLTGMVFVAVFSAIVCIIVFSNYATTRGQMMWDEAEHAFTGLVFLNDVQRSDPASLAAHMYEQILWPPLHPLLLSLFFMFFGPDILMGRTLSILLYFLFSLSMYFLGREIVNKNKQISGVLCSVFALITGSLYLSASEIMLEMLALLFFTLSLLFFLRFLKDNKLWWAVLVFAILTFFSKTNFGIVLIASIAIYYFIHEKFRFASLFRNRDFIRIVAPVALIILLWILPTDRLLIFLGFLANRSEGPPPFSIEGILYYPTQIILYSGLMVVLYAAAFMLSSKQLKNDKIRFLFIVAVLAILLNFFHQNKKMRYILYLYPPLFSMAAFHLTTLYGKISHKRKRFAFYLLLGVCMAVFSFYASSSFRLVGYDFSVTEPLDFIKNSTRNSYNIFVLGEINEISPGLISWHLSNATSIKAVRASTYAIWEFEEYYRLIKGRLGVPDRVSPERINNYIGKHDFDTIILIETLNESRFYNTEDFLVYNKWKLDYIPIVLENGNYTAQSRRLFKDIGIEITILEKIRN